MRLLLLTFCLINAARSHTECFHPIVNLTSTSVHQVESMYTRAKRAPQNIRITRYYDSSYTSMANSDFVTKNILDPAVQFWQNALLVNNPLTSPLIVDRQCSDTYNFQTVGGNRIRVCSSACASSQMCYNTVVPDQYLQSCYTRTSGGYITTGTTGTGAANTDLLLIVTQSENGCTGNVLAYAVACDLEYTLDRPVLGLINICPGKMNAGVGLKMAIATLKHEIGHVLGVSSNLFAFWRNQTGHPLTPRDAGGQPNLGVKIIGAARIYQYSEATVMDYKKTFNYMTGPISRTVSYIVTPTIQREIRNYFNCLSLEGMMLEDYGSASSALSHFEKLYLQNELMTASISINSLASRLTLAVLQDTGWYVVNFNNADNFTFAKNAGCPFVTTSCYDYMNMMQASGQPLAPYCNQALAASGSSCTPDRTSQQFCSLYDNSNQASQISPQFKYFTNPNLVSTDPFSEYCPTMMIYALTISGNFIYTGECQDSQNTVVQGTSNDYFNQGFGSSSMCVSFAVPYSWYYESCNSKFTPSIQGAGCYQYQCSLTYGLIIVVNNFQYQCYSANQIIDVTSKNKFLIPHGKLICPDCTSVCGSAICAAANSNLAVQCNNVDRMCPGVIGYTIPCSTSVLEIRLIFQMTLMIPLLLLRNNLFL